MALKITKEIKEIVKRALQEDIGDSDITTDLFIPYKNTVTASIICNNDEVILCGLEIAKLAFTLLDKNVVFKKELKDGQLISKGESVIEIKGKAKSILTAERTALNFLSLLSGISTLTYKFKNKTSPYNVKIMDTRKTHPGLRVLEKYAVRIGGGDNHRLNLSQMILIKDNHLKAIGGLNKLKDIMKKIINKIPKDIKIEIEVKNIKEFKLAKELKPDIIMLDNMSLKEIKKAAHLNTEGIPLDVSGNINLNNVRKIAQNKIKMVSIGSLTHSPKAVDFSLEII